jgi:hypothetical protein
MTLIRTAAIAILVGSLSGCYSAYTSIAKNADGSYAMTKNVAPFFGPPYGELLRCTEGNGKMTCKSVDRM